MKTQNKILIWISLTSSLAITACGIKLPDEPQQTTAHWADPANYSRTPTGDNPVDPITLSVDFSDQSGCPNETYRFWLFSADGTTPLGGIGQNAPSILNHFEQTIYLPLDTPVYAIRLVCTKANGDRYSNGTILEQGNPAFTPRVAISWQNPDNYARTPSGETPTNPITLSAEFTDESGCPTQMYRFWQYAQNGNAVGGVGSIMTMENFGVTTTASLTADAPVYAVRLACVDGDGNIADTTSNLEFGLPAFTPTTSGTCSGQNTEFCDEPTTSNDCTTCEGTWGTTSGCIDVWNQEQGYGGNNRCHALDGNQGQCVADGDYCTWDSGNSTCNPIEPCSAEDETECNANHELLGWCIWSTNVNACSNPNTATCVSPDDQTLCEACGGTWMPA